MLNQEITMPQIPNGFIWRVDTKAMTFESVNGKYSIPRLIESVLTWNEYAYVGVDSSQYVFMDFINSIIVHCFCINDAAFAREWIAYRNLVFGELIKSPSLPVGYAEEF